MRIRVHMGFDLAGNSYLRGLLVWLALLLYVGMPELAIARQSADSLRVAFPYSAMDIEPLPHLLKLSGPWYSEGEIYTVPFVLDANADHILQYEFELECIPDTHLYLLFEGVAWQSELILNQHYLGVHDDPFDPWLIPIQKEWLVTGKQYVEVRLSPGTKFPDYPQHFTGIFRPVWLLEADQVSAYLAPPPPVDSLHARVAIVAPWYGPHEAVFSEQYAVGMISPLLRENVRQVYFPFSPGRRLQNLFLQMSLELVPDIPDSIQVCAINAYPAEPGSISATRYFWYDGGGNRTDNYLSFFANEPRRERPPDVRYRGLLALMMLFPLLALFVIKWVSPNFFQSMADILFSPKLYIDTFADSTFANLGLVFLLISIKTLLMGIVLGLFIYYIGLEQQWAVLNMIKSESLISRIFYGSSSLPGIMLRSLFTMAGWLLIKYIVIWLFGKLYGFRGMTLSMLNLDIVSAFPLILILTLPVSFIFFGSQLWGGFFFVVIVITWLIYISRRLYVFYIGLDRLYMLSFGVKILYICAFIILPYIILF